MKRPFRLFESRRTPPTLPAIAGNGFLATTLSGLLMLLFGSAALMAAALSWQTAVSRGGVAGQARAAAERGFHAVIDRLNDPANGHLLVTNWAGSDWVSVSNSDLAACQITRNPLGAVARNAIFSDTQTIGGRQVRYTLTNFVPPRYPSGAPASLPVVCRTSFGNLQGGTARFTIRGEVLEGGVVLARYELQRDTTVTSFPDKTPGNPSVSGPLAFMSLGGEVVVESNTRLSLDTDLDREYDATDAKINIFCLIDCAGFDKFNAIPNASAGYPLSTFTSLFPPRPPYSTQLDGVTARSVTGPIANFPYSSTAATLSNSNLNSACRLVSLPTMSGQNQDAIACRISSIRLEGKSFIVDTSRNDIPVVLYLIGADTYLKESGSSVSTIVNTRFRDFWLTQPTSWNYLRIFGHPSLSSSAFSITSSLTKVGASKCNDQKQEFKLIKGSSINGAFVWLPRGNVLFEEVKPGASGSENYPASSRYGLFGALWACRTELKPNSVLLTNGSSDQIGTAIDQVFGLGVQFRYVAQGVERSQ